MKIIWKNSCRRRARHSEAKEGSTPTTQYRSDATETVYVVRPMAYKHLSDHFSVLNHPVHPGGRRVSRSAHALHAGAHLDPQGAKTGRRAFTMSICYGQTTSTQKNGRRSQRQGAERTPERAPIGIGRNRHAILTGEDSVGKGLRLFEYNPFSRMSGRRSAPMLDPSAATGAERGGAAACALEELLALRRPRLL